MNLLGKHRQPFRDFRQLVTIRHHSRKIFDCLALMRGESSLNLLNSAILGP